MSEIPWTWLAIRGSGLTAWALLTAVVVWGLLLRTRLLGQKASPVSLLNLHRWLGALALGFLAVHLGLLLVDPAIKFNVAQLLIPGLAPWQPLAVSLGILALWAMVPVAVVGRLRQRLGKSGNAVFRKAHLIAYAAWPLATLHYVMAGTDALTEWSLGLLLTGSTVIVLMLLARGFVPPPARKTPARPAATAAPAVGAAASPEVTASPSTSERELADIPV